MRLITALRYGRTVGKVLVGGVDSNLEQVKAGFAWHFKAYEREQPAEDRQVYARAEAGARAARAGVWRDAVQSQCIGESDYPRTDYHNRPVRFCLRHLGCGVSGFQRFAAREHDNTPNEFLAKRFCIGGRAL